MSFTLDDLPAVYDELRRKAREMSRAAPGTLMDTAGLHEALVRVIGGERREWNDRAHFIGHCLIALRRTWIDHWRSRRRHHPVEAARAAAALRRDDRVEDPEEILGALRLLEALGADEAVKQRARIVEVVECRYLLGMTVPEVAEVVGGLAVDGQGVARLLPLLGPRQDRAGADRHRRRGAAAGAGRVAPRRGADCRGRAPRLSRPGAASGRRRGDRQERGRRSRGPALLLRVDGAGRRATRRAAVTMGIDEIWLEVTPLRGAARERKLEELCAGDAELEARVRALLPSDEESTGARLEPPCRLGPYGLLERIASGAHGDVYRATREDIEGQVALKVLRRLPGASALVSDVRREASSARRIPSEHVVAIHGAGQIPGGPGFIEMALCADPDPMHPGAIRMGTSLRHEAIGPGGPRLPVMEAARLVELACRGAEAAHRTGIVHGDIKPENVLVTPISRRVMLADFGIATTLARHDGAIAPDGKVRSGTLAYMAPEQFGDGRAPDVRSDVYQLGGTLLFAITGEVPHPGRRLGAEGLVDAPRTALPPYVPQRLAEIVERALAPDPEQRYSSAGEMAEQLRRFRERLPTYDDEPQLRRRAQLFAERHANVLLALAAALVVSALLGLTGWRSFTAIVRDREAQLRELEGRQAVLDADGKRLHSANAELSEKRAALEAQVAELEERIDDSRRPLKELPKVRAELAAAKADLVARERSLAEARAEARARADDAEAARRAAEEKAARLQGTLTSAERAAQRVEAELERARELLERRTRLEAERDAARERAAALEARATALERQGAVLEDRLDASARAADELRAKLRDAERRAAAPRRPASATAPAPATLAPPAPTPPGGSTAR